MRPRFWRNARPVEDSISEEETGARRRDLRSGRKCLRAPSAHWFLAAKVFRRFWLWAARPASCARQRLPALAAANQTSADPASLECSTMDRKPLTARQTDRSQTPSPAVKT